MRLSLVAERYAKALFDFAMEKEQTEDVYVDAKELLSVCKANKIFVLMLKSPVISAVKKERILKSLFGNKFHEITIKFLLILVKKGREATIPEIAQHIVKLYKEYKKILEVRLITATPVTESIHHTIREMMHRYTNWQVELIPVIDPGIIGGFILNWGDMQYDASIRYQIERLRRGSARVNLYVKGF